MRSNGTDGSSSNPALGSTNPAKRSTANPNENSNATGALTPIPPPSTTGATADPSATSSGAPRQGPGAGGSAGNQTGLGNIGPETEKEQRAQDQSDKTTKRICNGC